MTKEQIVKLAIIAALLVAIFIIDYIDKNNGNKNNTITFKKRYRYGKG